VRRVGVGVGVGVRGGGVKEWSAEFWRYLFCSAACGISTMRQSSNFDGEYIPVPFPNYIIEYTC
jgi:hypothetical protein